MAVRHVAFEDLGLLEPLLAWRGHEVRYLDLPATRLWHRSPTAGAAAGATAVAGGRAAEVSPTNRSLLPDIETADLVVVLGGPVGVYETEAYPFLMPEIEAVGRRISNGGPTLGICLGAQILAAALGARVYPGGSKEIGWAPVELTSAGKHSPLRYLDAGLPVLHWHGDTFDLPDGAELLASTPHYANQAFWYPALGRGAATDGGQSGPTSMPPPHVMALQFHLEATGEGLEAWYVGHTAEIAATPGIEVRGLRAAGERLAGPLAPWASKIFEEWLEMVGL